MQQREMNRPKIGRRSRGGVFIILLLVWIFILITLNAVRYSMSSPESGLSVFLHQLGYNSFMQQCPLMCRHRESLAAFVNQQSQIAAERFEHLLLSSSLKSPSNEHHPSTYRLCPVVLSTVYRYQPHWLWLTSALALQSAAEEGNAVSPPIVLWREGGALQYDQSPFTSTFIQKIVDKGLVLAVKSNDDRFMPKTVALNKLNIIDHTFATFVHFLRQLFDHAFAWEQCIKHSCEYCLVFEDDVLMARHWKRRLFEAVDIANKQRGNWGVIKLFELDTRIQDSPTGWEVEHVPFIVSFGMLCGITVFVITMHAITLQLRQTSDGRNIAVLLGMWFVYAWVLYPKDDHDKYLGSSHVLVIVVVFPVYAWFFIAKRWGRGYVGLLVLLTLWCILIIAMLGQFCMLGDPYETIRTRYSDATVVREPLVPHRGAVANLYKTHDLVKLVAYVEEVSKNLTLGTPIKADGLRADVFINAYFKRLNRPLLVIEPNIIQHVGFVTSEPNSAYRVALSSTFEDGKVF